MIVKHRNGQYEVSLGDAHSVISRTQNAFVITDENVINRWRSVIGNVPTHAIKPGEQSKTISEFGNCLEWLAENKANRKSVIIAFGGGVVGDLAGFVAASYMRGINYIQIPTTLLSMVDSSVGGKVGVDLPQGKNLAGAFYPPQQVVIDLQTLSTLPEREFVNGAAEVWKYGAILDAPLFEQLERKPLGPSDDRLPKVVLQCVDLKRQVVEADEYETTGQRAILNFGHTVGHAIERVTGYGPILHGEAVAQGMVVEAAIGEKLGTTPTGLAGRLREGLEAQGLPLTGSYEPATLIESMRLDKKASDGRLAFALLTGLGSCKLVPDVPESVVLECLQEHL